ncbi:ankyrin repeat domain-containing protein [Simkania negevensis]|uniref:Uncharacterized protein n=1 Tax=Simkania negevensis (strain ATCC VR-1471 / DSM 27360 / Z) TaxID=331113 RepID=F8L474_SIMNZ|nr:ankyrin repeat domain-containing protein [Simkania negevensis]CCB90116.1 hypothetical protein SNE_A22390 [Simkania negevensis Z]
MLKQAHQFFLLFVLFFNTLIANGDWITPKFPDNPNRWGHIFKSTSGHFKNDTPENRAYIELAVESPDNKVGVKSSGVEIYLKTMPDGTQSWAEVWGGQIINGGKNNFPKIWVSDNSKNGGGFVTPKFTKYCPSDATFQGHLAVNKLRENFSYFSHTPQFGEVIKESRVLGVASRCGIILDLFDSFEEDENILFIPDGKDLLLTKGEIHQIMRDVARGVYVHNTLPFFSLHTNQNSIRYPVIPPCYRNTFVGYILGLLDYYMKGLAVGRAFDEEFIFEWGEIRNTNETYLAEHVLDFKELFRDDFEYRTFDDILLEICDGPLTSQAILNCFDISYRLIAFQNAIYQKGKTLSFDGGFDVVGIVKWDPTTPEETVLLEKLQLACDQMCEVIRQTLPKIPLCKKLLQGLKFANFLSYYYNTLKGVGKIPIFDRQFYLDETRKCPNVFPPVPLSQEYETPIDLYELFMLCKKEKLEDIHWFFKAKKPEKWVVDIAVDALYDALVVYFEQYMRDVSPEQIASLTVQLLDQCRSRYNTYKADITRLFHKLGVNGAPEAPGTVKSVLEKINTYLRDADAQEKQELLEYKNLTINWYQAPFHLCFNDSGVMFNRVNGSLKVLTGLSQRKAQVSGGCGSLVEDISTLDLVLCRQVSLLRFDLANPLTTPEGLYFLMPFETLEYEEIDEAQYIAAHQLYYPKKDYPFNDFVLKILASISSGDEALFNEVLRDIANWSFQDSLGASFVHYASEVEKPCFLEKLLQRGVNLEKRDDQGLSPMHYAARKGRRNQMQMLRCACPGLLEASAIDGETPLICAVQARNVTGVKTLLELGANPNHRTIDDLTPLLWAIYSGDEAIAMALLSDVRTDVHATWKLGVSAFELCIQQKLPKVLQYFLSIGISPNRKYRGDTPMHLAVESNWIEGVQILLDTRKVPHSAVNHQGETALELARRLGYDQIESLLRKR